VNKLGNVRTASIVVRCVTRLLFTDVIKKLLILEFKQRVA